MEVKVFNPLTSEFLKIFSDLRDPVASNHDKIIVVDDEWVVIGTYNMDPLSEQINSEVCVAVKAKSFAKRNRLRIEKDMAESIEYKVNVRSDGKIETVVGPESHVDDALLKRVEQLQKLPFLRSMI